VYVNDALNGQTTLVSVNTAGVPADGDSRAPSFSSDCTKILFESTATNLVLNDGNGASDVFVRDLQSRTTTIASINDAGEHLNGDSTHATINGAGTMVAFTSWASNVKGALPGHPGVYLHDVQENRTIAISSNYPNLGADVEGFSWPGFSADGRYLIFRSVTDPLDPSQGGKGVLVWDIFQQKSALTAADNSTPTGWNDACTTGLNNGTNFRPVISGRTGKHSYRVLFTVARDGVCNLVLRDLEGKDIPIRSEINVQQVLEPTINSTGDYLSWAVAGSPQLIYACKVDECSGS
jgi:Tol biopolymer transport system component